MKHLIKILPFFLLLYSCSGKQNTQAEEVSDETENKRYLPTKQDLLGIWTSDQGSNADIEINDSTISYLDQEESSELKYGIHKDTLFVYENQDQPTKTRIVKVKKDTLVLDFEGLKTVYVRSVNGN